MDFLARPLWILGGLGLLMLAVCAMAWAAWAVRIADRQPGVRNDRFWRDHRGVGDTPTTRRGRAVQKPFPKSDRLTTA